MTRIVIPLLIAVACIYLSAYLGTLSAWWVFPTVCVALIASSLSIGVAFAFWMYREAEK